MYCGKSHQNGFYLGTNKNNSMLYQCLSINNQYPSNMHANKQLVNSENWTPNLSVTKVFECHLDDADYENPISYLAQTNI